MFIYLFNLAKWRSDWWQSNIPTQVDAVHARSVCALLQLIKRPHTSERGSVCRFIGAPRAYDAYISPYQRTLIAPSMSEQIHVHTSIHKTSPTHSTCPLSTIFLLVLFIWTWKTYTHHSLYTALGDLNNLHFTRRIHNHIMHVKQTVTPLLHRRYTHTHKAFPRGAVTHMPVQQRHSLDTWLSYCYAEEDWAAPRAC